jgi:hypothetical protein
MLGKYGKTTLQAAGKSYVPTAEDWVWLARAVEAEGKPRLSVARTLVNLYASTGFSRRSLADLVRAYAQPVNPRWYPEGELYREHVAAMVRNHAPAKELAAELAKAERRKLVHSARDTFSPETVDAVNQALGSSWAEDWTDYAAPGIGQRKGYERRTADVKGLNTFWSRKPGWAGYSVTAEAVV